MYLNPFKRCSNFKSGLIMPKNVHESQNILVQVNKAVNAWLSIPGPNFNPSDVIMYLDLFTARSGLEDFPWPPPWFLMTLRAALSVSWSNYKNSACICTFLHGLAPLVMFMLLKMEDLELFIQKFPCNLQVSGYRNGRPMSMWCDRIGLHAL